MEEKLKYWSKRYKLKDLYGFWLYYESFEK